MHSPLHVAAIEPVADPPTPAPEPARLGGVHSADRLWDALAVLLIVSGVTLFLLARNGLASLAAGTHQLPPGIHSYVQRADYFSAQSSLGLGMTAIGVAIGLAATIRHLLRRRSAGAPPTAA